MLASAALALRRMESVRKSVMSAVPLVTAVGVLAASGKERKLDDQKTRYTCTYMLLARQAIRLAYSRILRHPTRIVRIQEIMGLKCETPPTSTSVPTLGHMDRSKS